MCNRCKEQPVVAMWVNPAGVAEHAVICHFEGPDPFLQDWVQPGFLSYQLGNFVPALFQSLFTEHFSYIKYTIM